MDDIEFDDERLFFVDGRASCAKYIYGPAHVSLKQLLRKTPKQRPRPNRRRSHKRPRVQAKPHDQVLETQRIKRFRVEHHRHYQVEYIHDQIAQQHPLPLSTILCHTLYSQLSQGQIYHIDGGETRLLFIDLMKGLQ